MRGQAAVERRRREETRQKEKKLMIIDKIAMTKMIVAECDLIVLEAVESGGSSTNIEKDCLNIPALANKKSNDDVASATLRQSNEPESHKSYAVNDGKDCDKCIEMSPVSSSTQNEKMGGRVDRNRDLSSDEASNADSQKQDERIATATDITASLYNYEAELESDGFLLLPEFDVHSRKLTNGGPRQVPNNCAICISEYEIGDEVVWSSNPECKHVFHLECMLMWLMKKDEPLCPCCRREFIEFDEIVPSAINNGDITSRIAAGYPGVHFITIFPPR
eukprot:CAMPEP_0172502578 /NCGR_PEP_ID=MMETSP1066-20121228/161145_1 /TAXON_ID=671091 /ORGANISM="Coscinodiscus wailesii, Strain CCMP2513" /LENGTH=276 /DNA_ID=CAMNT_0013277881 /DNA_START=21 /DNA_END=851 /DNA_ORIENTATION=+